MARVLDEEADREAVLARFVSSLSDRDEELLRRMLADPSLDRPRPGRRGPEVHVAVYLPLVVPVFAALAARPLADRLPPAAATWLLAVSALALALASSAVLGMLALSALVRIPVIDASVTCPGRSSTAATPSPCRSRSWPAASSRWRPWPRAAPCGGAAARSPRRTGTPAGCRARARSW